MKRRQWIELHDLEGCPTGVRDAMTDFMSWFAIAFRVFRPVVAPLSSAVRESGASRIVDLCAGGGGPSLAIARECRRASLPLPPIVLTDKYPNVPAYRAAAAASDGAISYIEESVDATSVPSSLRGFRTMYVSFHHFAPDAARSILRDAVRNGDGIGIFEYTERNFLVWGLPLLLTPLFTMLATPFVRPFRWGRLLWTYVVPLVPLISLWDGFVSCLRTYSVDELLQLAHEVDAAGYRWEAGRVQSLGACHVTYLIGCLKPA